MKCSATTETCPAAEPAAEFILPGNQDCRKKYTRRDKKEMRVFSLLERTLTKKVNKSAAGNTLHV